MYSILNKSLVKNIVWECLKCGKPIFSTSLFETTASLETHNRFDSLSSLSDPESPIPDIIGSPTAASSLIVPEPEEAKGKAAKTALNHRPRILIMNCQSIRIRRLNFIQLSTPQNQTSYLEMSPGEPLILKFRKFSQTPLMQFGKTEQVMPMVMSLLLLNVTCSVLQLRNWTPTAK